MIEQRVEEILEHIWTYEEESGERASKDMLSQWITPQAVESVLQDMLQGKFIHMYNSLIVLTAAGRKEAEQVVRRHRLAERLLKDVLELKHDTMDSSACEFEHILSEEVTTSICTLLGHPVRCPHGKLIPPGECCQRAKKILRPLVLTLLELAPGEEAKVAYITTKHHPRLDRLSSLGLLPGTTIRVHQKQPTLVITMGETQIALDEDIARDIYVRRSH
ncbi:MAG TPA: metal-dependent transcriptional regulator [Candidatus Hypogeohydataceae bacterium YC41]